MNYMTVTRGAVVAVPGGTFTMGSTALLHAQPVRSVTVSPVTMQTTDVSVGQFLTHLQGQAALPFGRVLFDPRGLPCGLLRGESKEAVASAVVVAATGEALGIRYSTVRQLIPSVDDYVKRFTETNAKDQFLREVLPATKVNWYEAAAYALLTLDAQGHPGRLPTEAEIEHAARAGREGDAIAGTDDGMVHAGNACFGRNWETEGPMPVGSFAANPWGLQDLAGNVWKWCADFWQDHYTALAIDNPTGPLFGNERVLRCGGWYDNPGSLRAAARSYVDPAFLDDFFGFRVVWPQDFPTPV